MQERQTSGSMGWVATVAAAVVVAMIAGIAAWFLWPAEAPEPAGDPPPAKVSEPVPDPEPRHPLPPVESGDTARGTLQPLPSLDDSDEYFKLEMTDLLGETASELTLSNALIEKLVATIDNLPRAAVAERVRPVGKPPGQFTVAGQDGSGEYQLDPANFARYDALTRQIVSADLGQAVDVYRRYYPLFQKAYESLGYPDGYFNDRLIEVIDHLLQTPSIDGPVALVRPHVLYQFADPELEALSAGQKLMLRIGPENRAALFVTLREFRSRIAAGAAMR